MKKKTTPGNTGIYIELGVLALFFIIMLSPIFIVIHNHNSESRQPDVTNTPSTPEKGPASSTTNPEHHDTPTDPAPSTTPTEQTPTPEPVPAQSTPTTPATPTAPSCHHEEQGICWDDIEDENYSAGLYDREYGHYGATIDYPDSCDQICRDIIDDAYDEGWYDGGY